MSSYTWNVLIILLLGISMTQGASVTGAEEKLHDRVIHAEKLSDKEHFQHHDGEEDEDFIHDPDYDHEAFLGKDEAHEFDQLTPEESQRRLGVIVDRIDKDGDGFVTFEEMRNWIKFTQDRYISDDVDRQWRQHNVENKETISWEDYRHLVYGFLDDQEGTQTNEDDDTFSYKRMENRDQRRWTVADEDNDGALSKLEFKHFLHPEESEHMRDIVVQETLDDIDKNGDGKISLDEYIGDMYHSTGDLENEPDWVKTERDSFANHRDENKDGFMDLEEVQKWILPTDYDHTEAEAKHLIFESDADGDQQLTKEEIVAKYDLFVGSQATDFGEALARHDEF